ncbi:MAG: hypothetical protein VKL20_03265 [Synechocystis sp.]|nr:hypothetical protein [Synechocystis sp.]
MKHFLFGVSVLLGATALTIDSAVAAHPIPLTGTAASTVPMIMGQIPVSPGLNRQSFFETGRLREEDTLMFRRPPSDVPRLRDDSSNWQFIIFQEGNVSFWMPPGVLTQDEVVLTTAYGDISFRTLVSNDGPYRYIAAYATDLNSQQVQNPEAILEAMRDRVAPQETFKLTGDRQIKLGDNPGVELTFQSDTDMIRMRTFLAGNQIYAVGVVQPIKEPRDRAARAFLNALQLIEP